MTGKDYKQQYLDFNRNEKRRINIMTKARFQPFCRANNINIGYLDGVRVFPRTVTEKDDALCLYNNHFCLIWATEEVRFNQTIKELKDNFKIFDNFITEENVHSHFKYEFIPKKIESYLTNFIVYDLETHNPDRGGTRLYCISFYRLIKISGRYNRDLPPFELGKWRKGTVTFGGENCVETALDFCLKLKGEKQKLKYKIVEDNL